MGGREREATRNTSLKGRALEREAQGSERERRERTESPVHGKLHHTYREREGHIQRATRAVHTDS